MPTTQLREIAYLFPNTTAETTAFFTALASLFAQAAGAEQQSERVLLTPQQPATALPMTRLQLCPVDFPCIQFDTQFDTQLDTEQPPIHLCLGAFRLYSSSITTQQTELAITEQVPDPTLLTAAEFAQRLAGHITRVDHTGVNLPVSLLARDEWDRLLQQLSGVANLYNYPTGEDWPFIIPATAAEFQGNIQDFVAGREPKFELVYDGWTAQPLLQFALGTDLTRTQLEALLPEPVGWVIPELADIFRSVWLAHPWPGLSIRFDLYYHSDELSDWDTGEWLVKAGGRIQ